MNESLGFKPIPFQKLFYRGLMVGVLLLPLLSFLACYISPHCVVFFQWLGLLLPVFIVFNFLLLLYGIYRKRWYSVFAGIALALAGMVYGPLVLQLDTPKTSDQTADIKLATFNVQQFRMMYNVPSIQNVAEFVADHQINTLCLQEVPIDYSVDVLKKAFPSMPYCTMTTDPSGSHHLAVLSKYPIFSSETISFDERPNCALIADLVVDEEKLRIFNCHLQTTNWNQVKKSGSNYSAGMSQWSNAISVMSDNFKHRANQTKALSTLIGQSPYGTLVCGDFNDPPVSYTYNTMKGNLKDAFREGGKGYGYTYRYFMKFFRIDFVFFSHEQLQVLNYQTADVNYSDHLPVMVEFKLGKNAI